MKYSKFLLLVLSTFALQGFAADEECIDMSGTYQCTIPQGGSPMAVTVTQTLNSDNAAVLSLNGTTPESGEATFSYIADKQLHDNYVASCTKDYFSILSPIPTNPGFFTLTTYGMPTANRMDIQKHVITIQRIENSSTNLRVVQNLGTMTCTKTQ